MESPSRTKLNFEPSRRFRDCEVHIEVSNPSGLNRGVSHLLVDGVRIEGNLLPLDVLKPVTRVEAVLGGLNA